MKIPLNPVESSQFSHIGWDAPTNTLAIQFHQTKKQREANHPSSIYHYRNVTPNIWREFQAADSLGSFFIRFIKQHSELHPYKRIQ